MGLCRYRYIRELGNEKYVFFCPAVAGDETSVLEQGGRHRESLHFLLATMLCHLHPKVMCHQSDIYSFAKKHRIDRLIMKIYFAQMTGADDI